MTESDWQWLVGTIVAIGFVGCYSMFLLLFVALSR